MATGTQGPTASRAGQGSSSWWEARRSIACLLRSSVDPLRIGLGWLGRPTLRRPPEVDRGLACQPGYGAALKSACRVATISLMVLLRSWPSFVARVEKTVV